jgi:hypothetical protein
MKIRSLLVGLALLPGLSLAQSMLCPDGIIDSGDTRGVYQKDVLAKCGPPNEKSATVWRYQREDFIYVLSFEDDGELISIDQEPNEEPVPY